MTGGAIVLFDACGVAQAFCLDVRKKTQGKKPSRLKEVTENSSSNPKKSALFGKFLEIFK